MKSSLTPGQSANDTEAAAGQGDRTDLHELLKPTRGAATAGPMLDSAHPPLTPAPAAPLPPAALLSANDRLRQRLSAVAPQLLDRPRPQGEARLLEILTRRIGALVADAAIRVRARLGAAAASLAAEERASLQDALLLARLTAEECLPEAIDRFTPGELFALLATGCLTHTPEQLDALRCREIVCGGDHLFAREAVLDLLAQGPNEALMRRLDTLVERRLAARVTALSATAGALLDGLTAPPARGVDGQPVHKPREEMEISGHKRLATALHRGNDDVAIDLMAKAAGVPRATIQAAIFLRTAKGLVSLAWRGGFDAYDAVTIQSALGHIAPGELIHPTKDGDFALGHAEMLWQCRFLTRTLPVSAA